VKNHLSLLVIAIAGAVALAFVFVFFLPQQSRIRELRQELDQQQMYISQSAQLPAVIAQMESDIARCQEFNKQWRSVTPQPGQLSELYRQITGEAQAAGVSLVNLRPRVPVTYALIHDVPLDLRLDGPFHPLADFLRRLEELPGSLRIREVKLQPTAENGQRLQCELTLSIFTESSDISD
jgi:type IV pilus assembly protein PilO